MKKTQIGVIFVGILLIMLSLVSAINLEVTPKPVSTTAITDLNEPAAFDLVIKNNGDTDNFQIYSLVGIDITPKTPVQIISGETKTIRIYLTPQQSISTREEPLPFEYQIKNSKNEIQMGTLTIRIMNIERAIPVNPGNINPQSEKITIELKNLATYNFDDLKIKLSSVFFPDYESSVPLNSLETKNIDIVLDKNKVKVLDAGHYLLNIQLTTKGITSKKEAVIKFVEQPNIDTKDTKEGFLINRHEIIKKNIGNVKEIVTITSEKNLISYLFTTTNLAPKESKIQGFKRVYFWEKELIPDDELKVVLTTNWLYPILIIILIVVIVFLIKRSIERDLVFRKNVSFVRTKGGEFALKVSLRIKSKKFIEKINITDKLPHLVNLYEKFGAVSPDKIDLKNRRLEWNIESMNKGEERIFSYIIYSHKVGVIGRYELPSARAVYERDGKIKEFISNRAFFINEPRKS